MRGTPVQFSTNRTCNAPLSLLRYHHRLRTADDGPNARRGSYLVVSTGVSSLLTARVGGPNKRFQACTSCRPGPRETVRPMKLYDVLSPAPQ